MVLIKFIAEVSFFTDGFSGNDAGGPNKQLTHLVSFFGSRKLTNDCAYSSHAEKENLENVQLISCEWDHTRGI